MNLIKHSLEETPSLEIPLLILINLNDKNKNVWTVGKWTQQGWSCEFNNVGYDVIEWYELPPQRRLFLSSNANGRVLEK